MDRRERALITIALPLVDAAPVTARHGTPSAGTAAVVARTVLLVDDDAPVRTAVARLLRKLGYEVEVAESGQMALEFLQAPGSQIDAIISDYAMPGMTGVELLATAHARGVGRPFLMMSGFTDDPATRELLGQSGVRFLAKPFTGDELARELALMWHPSPR